MDKALMGMCFVRMLSGCLEISAALLMWHFGSIRTALRINAALGLCGPAFLLAATLIGLGSLIGSMSPVRMLLVGLGVFLIIIAAQ